MPWFDVLIFAAVAIFLALRLRKVLGERHGEERERPNPFRFDPAAQTQQSAPAPAPADAPTPMPAPSASQPINTATLEGRISQIRGADPNFNEKGFLNGAKGAFEMIVKSFAAGDTAALRPLLSDDVYDSFAGAIRARQAAGETLETKIVRIRSTDLLDASMTLNTARVTVRFTSEQIQVTTDKDGKVIEGDPAKSFEVTDRWTFSRNTRALDPNWQLAETRSES